MASDILMHYPNPNKPFELYTDAYDYQMGAVILQEGKPVAYWSRKLNPAQKNYSVIEKECFRSFIVSRNTVRCYMERNSPFLPITRI